jgi:hypothetical protein
VVVLTRCALSMALPTGFRTRLIYLARMRRQSFGTAEPPCAPASFAVLQPKAAPLCDRTSASRGGKKIRPARNSAHEAASGDGKDAFHRVPFFAGEVNDAVERVLTGFRGAWRAKGSGDSLPAPA